MEKEELKNRLISIKNNFGLNCYYEIKKEKLLPFVIQYTDFLDKNSSDMQRIWHIINEDNEIHVCKFCGNKVKFRNKTFSYNKTCNEKSCFKKLVSEITSSKEIIEKRKKTCVERYGSETYLGNKDNIDKIKINGQFYFQSDEFKEKRKKKIDQKSKELGCDYYSLISQKSKETLLRKHGNNYFQSDEFKSKIKNGINQKYGSDFEKTEEFQKLVENNFKSIISNDGFSNILKYVSYGATINGLHDIKCKKCNEIFTITSSLYNLRKIKNHIICTNCNPTLKGYSSQEKELLDFIKEIYNGEIIENSRSIISPYEIDIYLPEVRLAIEYNGNFFHSIKNVKSKNYHENKTKLCLEQGIQLVHIWEYIWESKKEIVKSIFINKLYGHIIIKNYARKCKIKLVEIEEEREFLKNNHLKGYTQSTICIGLYNENNKLLQIISFRKTNYGYELKRNCTLINNCVIGGLSKIWSYFIKNYTFDSILTFNDRNIFIGECYERLGFKLIKINEPNYKYLETCGKISSKQTYRTNELKKESEYEKELNLLRIYECGIGVYLYGKDIKNVNVIKNDKINVEIKNDYSKDEIIQFINNHKNNYSIMKEFKNYMKVKIDEETKHLPLITDTARVYHYINNINEIPVCQFCKKHLIFSQRHKYGKFCNMECQINYNNQK